MGSRKKPKALILDDEPPFERLFNLVMAMLGWECEVVDDPEKALARLKADHFDLVITDYHMPQGDGLQFICCLRREGITLPAIVMSGDAQALRTVPKDMLHIPAVLLKPFNASTLNAALKAALAV